MEALNFLSNQDQQRREEDSILAAMRGVVSTARSEEQEEEKEEAKKQKQKEEEEEKEETTTSSSTATTTSLAVQRELQIQRQLFTLDSFLKAFPIISPLFSKEVGVNLIIDNPSISASSSSSVHPQRMSLADQIRAEEAAKNKKKKEEEEEKEAHNNSEQQEKERGENQKQKEEEEVKSEKEQAQQNAVPATSSKNNNANNNSKYASRTCGYAPRGRRGMAAGRGGGRGGSLEEKEKQQEEDEEKEEEENSGLPTVIEVFSPSVQSDLRCSVRVDERMPASSERSFHNLLHCIVTSILLRDRSFQFDKEPQQEQERQKIAEKAVAFNVVKFAYDGHFRQQQKEKKKNSSASSSSPSTSLENLVKFDLEQMRSFSSTFADAEETEKSINSILKEILEPLRFLLVPLPESSSLFLSSSSSCSSENENDLIADQYNYLTRTAPETDERKALCSCSKLAGRLENIRWQLIRKTIDSSSFSVALEKVLQHWDPLILMKRLYPKIYREWFFDLSSDQILDLASAVSLDVAEEVLQAPMTMSFAVLIGNAFRPAPTTTLASITTTTTTTTTTMKPEKKKEEKRVEEQDQEAFKEAEKLEEKSKEIKKELKQQEEAPSVENIMSKYLDVSNPGSLFVATSSKSKRQSEQQQQQRQAMLMVKEKKQEREEESSEDDEDEKEKLKLIRQKEEKQRLAEVKEKLEKENEKKAIRQLAQDVLVFRKFGYPQRTKEEEEEEEEASKEKKEQASKKEVTVKVEKKLTHQDEVELCCCVFKWWAVLLREQCSVCCTKVFY